MFAPRPKSLDPIKLLQDSDVGRVPGLIPVKYQRMAESAFKFFRGAAIIQARDLANARVSGIMVQACGDCHLMNFGGYASPERALVFDVNEFDETFPAPWEWDIKRLGASFALAARDLGFLKSIADAAVRAVASSYRERMSEFAEMTVLDTWYAQLNVKDPRAHFAKDADMSARLTNQRKHAFSQTSEAVIPKLTATVDGRLQIKDNHHPQQVSDFHKQNYEHFPSYKESLPADRLPLFLRYRLVDAARKS